MVTKTSRELKIGNRAQTHVDANERDAPQVAFETGQGKSCGTRVVHAGLQHDVARSRAFDSFDWQRSLLREDWVSIYPNEDEGDHDTQIAHARHHTRPIWKGRRAMTARSDSPGVWFAPPLLYALAVSSVSCSTVAGRCPSPQAH